MIISLAMCKKAGVHESTDKFPQTIDQWTVLSLSAHLYLSSRKTDAQGRAEEGIAGPVEAQDADTDEDAVAHHLHSNITHSSSSALQHLLPS